MDKEWALFHQSETGRLVTQADFIIIVLSCKYSSDW